FFQAEDGIRDPLVTGVQTCALPILVAVMLPYLAKPSRQEEVRSAAINGLAASQDLAALDPLIAWTQRGKPLRVRTTALEGLAERSEERRVGKGCRVGGRRHRHRETQ